MRVVRPRIEEEVGHAIQRKIIGIAARAAELQSPRIEPAPKHTDLANRVSTYREQVTRELSALARAGVLVRDGGALVVRDMVRLQSMADGGR